MTNTTQQKADVFNALESQEIRKIVEQTGIYLRGAVEDYEIEGNKGKSGFIQLAVIAREGSKRLKIETIKVREDCFGLIDILNKSKQLQAVSLTCEIVTYGNSINTYLVQEQRSLKVA